MKGVPTRIVGQAQASNYRSYVAERFKKLAAGIPAPVPTASRTNQSIEC